ncbi:MAG: hypothetical protein RBU30_06530 [Polyangia bacterium]|nr:hypothetical protein [Polyangia bacterium]
MRTRRIEGFHPSLAAALFSALFAALLVFGAGGQALAADASGASDSDLRGYKGGLVEITLRDGTTVRGVLYGHTETYLELDVAQDRSLRLHRSWIQSLRGAPTGSQKSDLGAFPRNPREEYRAEPPRPRETPLETPRERPREASGGSEAPAAAAAPAEVLSGSVLDKGLVFQLRLGGNLLTILGGGIASWLNGSFLLGYKMGRLTLGLGLEMTYSDESYPNADPDPTETSVALMLFQPTIEYYLAMRGALALYATAGLHLGFLNARQDPGKDVIDPMIGFHLGLGLRYFFAPRFAVGIEGGLRGVWLMAENDEDTNEDDENTGVLSLYGAATLTAIW